MERLIFTNYQSPGDIVMLTAAVRDLHLHVPGRYLTDVRTSCPALWLHNPHLTRLVEDDSRVRVMACHYPLIHDSNDRPVHFLLGFIEFINTQLNLEIRLTRRSGDLHLSRLEKARRSLVERQTGVRAPYWIVVAGGKYDFTIKWWHVRRWQAVVDHFRDRLLFVQVGEKGHYHPPLAGVVDLRGRTTLRELLCLVYRAEGVLCPVTLAMHLAAAVESAPGGPDPRPCVVVAGGREPPAWEEYPAHRFLHTVGVLPCCERGGCWRSRIVSLGDGQVHDRPEHLCACVVEGLPACMRLITVPDVIQAIEHCLVNRPQAWLSRSQASRLRDGLSPRRDPPIFSL